MTIIIFPLKNLIIVFISKIKETKLLIALVNIFNKRRKKDLLK